MGDDCGPRPLGVVPPVRVAAEKSVVPPVDVAAVAAIAAAATSIVAATCAARGTTDADGNYQPKTRRDGSICEPIIWPGRENGVWILDKLLGRGAYGTVFRAMTPVGPRAVKMANQRPLYKRCALLEIEVLRQLQGCEHVVQATDSFMYQGHVCIVLQLMKCNLYEELQQTGQDGHGSYNGFPLERIQREVMPQLLHALEALREAGIVHRDLKPENILMGDDGCLRLADFGSACRVNASARKSFYHVSRFYRSVEECARVSTMHHAPAYYHPSLDMWSLACVLYELLGTILFPGRDEHDMLCRIVNVQGPLPQKIAGGARADFFVRDGRGDLQLASGPVSAGTLAPARIIVQQTMSLREKIIWRATRRRACYPNTTHWQYLSFCSQLEPMLRMDPTDRIEPKQALELV